VEESPLPGEGKERTICEPARLRRLFVGGAKRENPPRTGGRKSITHSYSANNRGGRGQAPRRVARQHRKIKTEKGTAFPFAEKGSNLFIKKERKANSRKNNGRRKERKSSLYVAATSTVRRGLSSGKASADPKGGFFEDQITKTSYF